MPRAPVLLLALATSACASLRVTPVEADAGTFRASAMAFTFFGHDYPQSALLLARANAADTQLPNLVIEKELVFPYFWRLDFLLDVVSLRWAVVHGRYGPADPGLAAEPARRGAASSASRD